MEREKNGNFLDITDDQIDTIYESGKDANRKFIRFLIDKLNGLEQKIKDLEKQISKDSHNSNKPPSSDNPFKKTKSLRKKTGKKPGGQKGHKGTNLKQVTHPDEVSDITPKGLCSCKKDLKDAKVIDCVKRQLFDLLLPQLFITEYKGEILQCECGRIYYPDFPSCLVKEAQYGPNIKSLVVYLKQYGFISYDRMAELFSDIFNISISQGTFVNIINECSKKIKPCVEKIREELKNSSVLHCDESGVRIEGSLHWVHSAGTKNLTYYYPHKNRGFKAMEAIGLLPFFKSTLIHDHWGSYFRYEQCLHGLCNTHHLRELTFFEEKGEKWAKRIKRCLIDAYKEKQENIFLGEKQINKYKRRLRRLINEGFRFHPKHVKKNRTRGRPKQSKEYNLLSRLKERLNDVLRFIIDPNVPFDNNQAERDIRMLKIQQKVSGSFRSMKGALSFCRIRSYISSIRKCGQSVFKALTTIWSVKIVFPNVSS